VITPRRAAASLAALVSLLAAEPVPAAILLVEPVSGTLGRIIAAPAEALDAGIADDDHVLGFDERQNLILPRDLAVDQGTIPAGTRVSSHLILFNQRSVDGPRHGTNDWTFDGIVIGVMSDVAGRLEAESSALLGAPGTLYPPEGFAHRGFESPDRYSGVGTRTLRVEMRVWQPGDWIRVITAAQPIARR